MLELHPRASLSGTPFMRRARFRLHYATLPAWPNDDRFPKWVRAGSIAVRPTRRGLQFWVPVALEDLRRRRVAVPNALRRAARPGWRPPAGGEPEWSDVVIEEWLCRGMVHAFAERHVNPCDQARFCAALLGGCATFLGRQE